MGFLVEAQAEDELPERLFGAVRVAQMEMSSATFVDNRAAKAGIDSVRSGIRGMAKVNHHHQKDRSSSRVVEEDEG